MYPFYSNDCSVFLEVYNYGKQDLSSGGRYSQCIINA